MVTLIEWGLFALLTTGTGLLSAFIVWKIIKPGLKAAINGYIPVIGRMVKKQMGEFTSEALENIDLGGIGAEGGALGDISGLLGGGGGGIGELLKLFSQLSGKGKEGGGSSGW